MELKINISSIQDIVQGSIILNSLIMSHKAQQEAALPGSTAAPAATKAAAPASNAGADTVVPLRPAAEPKASAAAPAVEKRGPGRPKKALTAKQAAAAASHQPVGAVLAGVPAHDLASALDAGGAAVQQNNAGVRVHSAPEVSEAERAEVARGLNGGAPTKSTGNPIADDPDLAGSFTSGNGAAAEKGAFTFDDADIFGAPPEPPPAVAEAQPSPYDGKSTAELDALWRLEGQKRGVHWLRAMIQANNIKGASDLTREMIIEALDYPERYMPPTVA
jgi:hypothetical protein